MKKRGARRYEECDFKLVPFRVIAKKLNCSIRTVYNDYISAIDKLKQIPGAFEILLSSISR